MDLKLISFNLRGFNSSLGLLHDLCNDNCVISIQEHWLRPDELNKLALVHSDFNFSAVSGMNNAVSAGVLSGRPFGGVGFLWNKRLNNQMSFIKGDPEGRCLVYKLNVRNRSILLINVYLPCCDNSIEYKNEINFYAAFIVDVLELVNHTDVIIMGDFNFEFEDGRYGYSVFKPLLQRFDLNVCTDNKNPTYCNVSLNNSSCIDHFVVSTDIKQCRQAFTIIDSGLNQSDHMPIALSLEIDCSPSPANAVSPKVNQVYNLRWDKACLNEYYRVSGDLLTNISLLRPVSRPDIQSLNELNNIYRNIVGALGACEKNVIPRTPHNALKPFWNEDLDALKVDSIFWHNLWLSAGRPTCGHLFQIKRSVKLKYKLAIRNAFKVFECQFDDDLYKHFLNKKIPEFWKSWSRKFRRNSCMDVAIDGSNDATTVSNAFAKHFMKVYDISSNSLSTDSLDIDLLLSGSASSSVDFTAIFDVLNVELVDRCIRKLHLGKACGPDGLSAEHLIHAHPILVVHLCALFRYMIVHQCVPDDFGKGVIIPLLKDKLGCINSLDNYRGITLIPVIAKLFELVILELCSDCLLTDELQFGFKPKLGCPNAIFAFRTTIDHFIDRGSTIYAASLDISKAFDRVNHLKLFETLSKTGLPSWILVILINWYGKLTVAVKWKSAVSNSFGVGCGVRQGSSLSPSIFNVFMDLFIIKLRALSNGCCVGNHFLGCILYADDIILLSASVSGLQNMLNCCSDVSHELLLSFNCAKSCCFAIGTGSKFTVSDMSLGNDKISWFNTVKYLGVTFTAGRKLSVNTDVIKQHFFVAANSVLGHTNTLDELIRLKLLESYCLPILQYSTCALQLHRTQCVELNTAWNSVFRRVFNFRKYDSVRLVICGLERLDFHHIRSKLTLTFIKNCLQSSNKVVMFLTRLFTLGPQFQSVCQSVDIDVARFNKLSFCELKSCVFSHFIDSCN